MRSRSAGRYARAPAPPLHRPSHESVGARARTKGCRLLHAGHRAAQPQARSPLPKGRNIPAARRAAGSHRAPEQACPPWRARRPQGQHNPARLRHRGRAFERVTPPDRGPLRPPSRQSPWTPRPWSGQKVAKRVSRSLPGRCGSPRKLMALPNRAAQVANDLSQPSTRRARSPGCGVSSKAPSI